MSDSLRPHESQHARPPCPSPTPGVYSDSCPLSRWCHPAISSSVIPFSSCPQYLPASPGNHNQQEPEMQFNAAKSLQSCPTLCDPIDGSPPGPPPLGFSRQEYWSGVPLPSPLKCNTSMQSQKQQNDLCSFTRQTIQYHSNPRLCPDQ